VVGVDGPGDDRLAQAGLASRVLRVRRPVTGSAVNSTPALRASTIRWTTTASATPPWSMPAVSR
jgi:hypothetical protein